MSKIIVTNGNNAIIPRRLLSKEVAYADNSRHYGFYIDGDIAKLPGGGRKGAAVLCELIPDQLAQDPGQQQQQQYPGQQQREDPRYGNQGKRDFFLSFLLIDIF